MVIVIFVIISGIISFIRVLVLVFQRVVVVVKFVGVVQRLYVFCVLRIVSDCEVVFFCGVKCEVVMVGKDM